MKMKPTKQIINEIQKLRKRNQLIKKAEQRTKHFLQALHAIRNVNQLIAKEKNRDALIQKACDLMIETHGYFNVWIVLLDEQQNYLSSAESGLGPHFEPMKKMLENGKLTKCGKNALEKNELIIIRNPQKKCKDCPLSEHYANRGAYTIRLSHHGKIYGLLSVSIPNSYIQDKEEKELFKEVAGDISYGLYNIKLEKEKEKILHQLSERTKKITCLYRICEISNKPDSTIEQILKKTLELIPSAWQYPEITACRISLEDKEYKTKNFKKTNWMLKSDIVVNNKKVGSIEVFYSEERSELYEGPFLKEERKFVNSIATRLGFIVKNKKTEAQIKKDLKEKNVMLQEIHHRVKNNMQIISSILHLQSQRVTDKKTLKTLQACRDRIKNMALIHESLYESQNLAEVDIASYTKKMTTYLFAVNRTISDRINLKVDIENIFLDINRAIPVGLIINELVSNAFIHGFPENKKGNVFVKMKLVGKDTYILIVSDNGVGLPERYEWTNPKTLGLQLVSSLVSQINGTLNISCQKGTQIQIKF